MNKLGATVLLIFFALSCQKAPESNKAGSELERIAETFIDIIVNQKDIDAFVELYHDSVQYSDPVWGVIDEYVHRDTLKLWFTPVFDPETGWDFEIDANALDTDKNTFAFKGTSIDLATGERRLVTSWIEVKDGRIFRQTDLTPWSLSSLKYSPRFEEALKDYQPGESN